MNSRRWRAAWIRRWVASGWGSVVPWPGRRRQLTQWLPAGGVQQPLLAPGAALAVRAMAAACTADSSPGRCRCVDGRKPASRSAVSDAGHERHPPTSRSGGPASSADERCPLRRHCPHSAARRAAERLRVATMFLIAVRSTRIRSRSCPTATPDPAQPPTGPSPPDPGDLRQHAHTNNCTRGCDKAGFRRRFAARRAPSIRRTRSRRSCGSPCQEPRGGGSDRCRR